MLRVMENTLPPRGSASTSSVARADSSGACYIAPPRTRQVPASASGTEGHRRGDTEPLYGHVASATSQRGREGPVRAHIETIAAVSPSYRQEGQCTDGRNNPEPARGERVVGGANPHSISATTKRHGPGFGHADSVSKSSPVLKIRTVSSDDSGGPGRLSVSSNDGNDVNGCTVRGDYAYNNIIAKPSGCLPTQCSGRGPDAACASGQVFDGPSEVWHVWMKNDGRRIVVYDVICESASWPRGHLTACPKRQELVRRCQSRRWASILLDDVGNSWFARAHVSTCPRFPLDTALDA